MRRLFLLAAALTIAGLSPALAETPPPAAPTPPPAQAAPPPNRTVDLKTPDGAVVGHVSLWSASTGVLVRVEVSGLTPGWHGLHLHQTGDCAGPAFASAGSHMQGAQHGAHGFLSAGGPEAGDAPNLFVGQDGRGAAEFWTRRVALEPGGDLPALLDADGSALVIHAAADDQFTQPTGGSGARIACAVIR